MHEMHSCEISTFLEWLTMNDQHGLTIFISYSNKDKDFLNLFKPTFNILKRKNLRILSDEDIAIGKNLDKWILEHIDASNIIICLVSIDYTSSDYIVEKELPIIEKKKNTELMLYRYT